MPRYSWKLELIDSLNFIGNKNRLSNLISKRDRKTIIHRLITGNQAFEMLNARVWYDLSEHFHKCTSNGDWISCKLHT